MGAATSLAELRDVKLGYRTGSIRRVYVEVVHGVSFGVVRGQTLGIVGESGSGKSTIGRALLGDVLILGGTVHFDGEDITNASRAWHRELARRIQPISQDPYAALNPARTVGDTLAEGPRLGLGVPAADASERVEQALADVGLSGDVLTRYPAQFSGGQRQRIGIARALAMRPDLVVCDEPTSSLDLSAQAQVLNLLLDLQRDSGLTYIFISHDLPVVRLMSDVIAVVHDGRVVEYGPAEDIATAPRHPYTQRLLDAVPSPYPER
jgi:peptide/nickel transport system ATP-binding protein